MTALVARVHAAATAPVFVLGIDVDLLGDVMLRRLPTDQRDKGVPIAEIGQLIDGLALLIITVDRQAPTTPSDRGHVQVLIIDDDPEIRRLISDALTMDGFSILSAGDGSAGLAMALQLLPNVILLDLTLPGRSGLDVLRTLKAQGATRSIPIIVVTADAAASASGDLALADGVLHKPFDLDELATQVRHAMRSAVAS
jgi:CheY-like chemotaxis protein